MQKLIKSELRRRKEAKYDLEHRVLKLYKKFETILYKPRPILQDEIEYPEEEFTFKLNLHK
jgi:hypothetical protein